VHRLDKDTSGLLIVAKTEAVHAALGKQLKRRAIRRRYLAVVEGHLPLNTGTVNLPIGRHLRHRKQMSVRHLGGRSAVTHYRVLRRFDRPFASTLVAVSLDTGRTHQIRVHMAHLGHPVAGDPVYGKHPAASWQGQGVNRQLLHAYALTFTHPVTRREMGLLAPVPEEFRPWCDSETLRRF
jgi:23S rRNA pseudouridine1911/1915/1917 synthase